MRAVGAAPATPTGPTAILRGSLFTLTLAGLVGGLFAFGLVELIAQPGSDDPWYGNGEHAANIMFSLVMGLEIGLVIAGWDGIQARNFSSARLPA